MLVKEPALLAGSRLRCQCEAGFFRLLILAWHQNGEYRCKRIARSTNGFELHKLGARGVVRHLKWIDHLT